MALTLEDIAGWVEGTVVGDRTMQIQGFSALESAVPGEISFYSGTKYRVNLTKTRASAIFCREPTDLFPGAQVLVKNPVLAYARTAARLARPLPRHPGISERAFIAEEVTLGRNPSISPFVHVGRGTRIGDDVLVFPMVHIGEDVRIGDRCVIHPNVTLLDGVILGNDVIIHSGTVIGSDGFGYVRDGVASIKIPQVGTVQIDDAVELGANNCVDRATHGKTWIQKGVKTDNLVHIAHNVVVGEHTVIVAQTGIAGSTRVGREVLIGGQVAIGDHLEIGDRVMIGSKSGVPRSIPPGGVFSGIPVLPHGVWLKVTTLIKRLPQFYERLTRMERRMEAMETERGAEREKE